MKLSSLYFNYIKNEGTVRLLVVLGCICITPIIVSTFTDHLLRDWGLNEWLLNTVFWFYVPFLIAAPIKFIKDGFEKSKK